MLSKISICTCLINRIHNPNIKTFNNCFDSAKFKYMEITLKIITASFKN